jgi:hypothetical protein
MYRDAYKRCCTTIDGWERHGNWKYFTTVLLDRLLASGLTCPYCRDPITRETFSLDRVNNKQHHTSANCIITCGPCNITRSDQYEVDEFMAVCFLRALKDKVGGQMAVALPALLPTLQQVVDASAELTSIKDAAAKEVYNTLQKSIVEEIEEELRGAEYESDTESSGTRMPFGGWPPDSDLSDSDDSRSDQTRGTECDEARQEGRRAELMATKEHRINATLSRFRDTIEAQATSAAEALLHNMSRRGRAALEDLEGVTLQLLRSGVHDSYTERRK